jgi:hypothetical protein
MGEAEYGRQYYNDCGYADDVQPDTVLTDKLMERITVPPLLYREIISFVA